MPLIFMGEECGSRDPFLYFTTHGSELAARVREGRRREFAGFAQFADDAALRTLPDPNDESTFESCRPRERGADGARWRSLYRQLLGVRRERLMPRLADCRSAGSRVLGPRAVEASWRMGDGSMLTIAANFDVEPVPWDGPTDAAHVLHASGAPCPGGLLAARSTVACLAPPAPADLVSLAAEAGLAVEWADYLGRPRFVGERTLRRTLTALGVAHETAAQMEASRLRIAAARDRPALRTARVGGRLALELPAARLRGRLRGMLRLESGVSQVIEPTVEGTTLHVPVGDTPGYHEVELDLDGEPMRFRLAVAPLRAHGAGMPRCWGTAVQVYGLRPESSRAGPAPGVGDYSALAAFAVTAARAGAQALAVSPTHAGFAADPSHCSPYSPSSRLFHNILFIDPVAEFGASLADSTARSIGLAARMPASADAAEIDWVAAGDARLAWLRALFDATRPDAVDCHDALRLHATFEALHRHFTTQGLPSWRDWPAAYRNPDSAEVRRFAQSHRREVEFHAWLQVLADRGLERAQRAAIGAGMRIGLIADLAIGMSPDGSHAWAAQHQVLADLEVGAPPDLLSRDGQAWGLATFPPSALLTSGFEPFLATLRAAMRRAGGVRIDHVLGLNRLWVVPRGLSPHEGVYLEFPFEDLLNLVVLESHRHRALVIGEDLGTVPAGLQDALAERGIFGMSVLWFERGAEDGAFTPSGAWRAGTVAMTTTHDLPTVAGWWRGRDLAWRERLGLGTDHALAARDRERQALAALAPQVDPGSDGLDLAIEVVAQAASPLALVPIEDLLGLEEQPNLPGTVTDHPNWRRRLPWPADRLLDAPGTARRIERLRQARPGAAGARQAPALPSSGAPLDASTNRT